MSCNHPAATSRSRSCGSTAAPADLARAATACVCRHRSPMPPSRCSASSTTSDTSPTTRCMRSPSATAMHSGYAPTAPQKRLDNRSTGVLTASARLDCDGRRSCADFLYLHQVAQVVQMPAPQRRVATWHSAAGGIMDQWRTPGHRLKLYLLAHGIAIDPAAEHAWRQKYDGPLSLSEYASTSGVCLYTRSGAYVNAPFLEEFTRNSAAVLRHWAGEFVIEFQGQMFSVGVVPVPQYHKLSYRDGDEWYPYTNLGVTHTDRVRISPIEGCAWRCRFCDMGYEKHYRKKPVEELVEVIRLAAKDPLVPARHVLISGGTPHTRDQGWLDDVYEYVAARSPLPVDVMMPARTDPDYHRWLRSVGVQMVSINL